MNLKTEIKKKTNFDFVSEHTSAQLEQQLMSGTSNGATH